MVDISSNRRNSGAGRDPVVGRYVYAKGSGATYSFGGRGTVTPAYASGGGSTNPAVVIASNNAEISGGWASDQAVLVGRLGGTVVGATALNQASIAAIDGGFASNVTVSSGGGLLAAALHNTSAGSVINPHVMSGGFALTGGGEVGFSLKGQDITNSGGFFSGGTYDSGAIAIIGKGGTALGGTFGGTQITQNTGSALNGIFSGSGATQVIMSGALVSASRVISGGTLQVSGGTASGLVAQNGGTILVGGGTYLGILNSKLDPINHTSSPDVGAYTSGVTYGDRVDSGATGIVTQDGIARSVTVTGGTEIVSSGGQVVGLDANGGMVDVDGGYAAGVKVGGNGTALVHNQGTAAGMNLSSGTAIVENGGSATGGTTGAGGTEIVSSGGITWDRTLTGGTLDVNGGIVSQGTVADGGRASIHSGGTAVDMTVADGGTTTVADGGLTMGGTVLGGTEIVTSNGTAQDLNVSDGLIDVQQGGHAPGLVVNGGTALVHDGGYVATGTAFDGTAIIANGGTAHRLAVSGADVSVSSGGSVDDLSINGGNVHLYSGAHVQSDITVQGDDDLFGVLYVESGMTLGSVTALSQGSAQIENGAFVSSATAGAQGTVMVQGGGSVQNATGNGNDGYIGLGSGAHVGSMYVINGATGVLNAGATADRMLLSGGIGTVTSGALVSNLLVASGASAVLMSGASAVTINIASGGWISGAEIGHNNSIMVFSGGTAVHTVVGGETGTTWDVNIGEGSAFVISGGSAVDTVISGGGQGRNGARLTIQKGASLSHTSIGWNGQIRVIGLQYDNNGYTYVQGGTLYVVENGTTWSAGSLNGPYADGTGSPTDGFRLMDDGYGNTIIVYQCFLAGTLIRMEDGEVPVESIRRGDRICVYNDGRQEVREVLTLRRGIVQVEEDKPDDMANWAVQVCKDAFAPGVPSQDLFVTPEHCFYFDGRFVPVRMLVNGQSIRYDKTRTQYEYYHVETRPHAIIWANNTLTESYLETGSRMDVKPVLHEDEGDSAQFIPLHALTWEKDAAVPLDVSQAFVEPLYHHLYERAVGLGQVPDAATQTDKALTDPDLRLLLDDGTVVEKTRQVNGRWVFALPGATRSVRLLSRRFRPSEMVGPFLDDRRSLGVLIGDITLWVGGHETALNGHLTHKDLPGWSVPEAGSHRWTLGDAILPLPQSHRQDGEQIILAVQVQAGGPYPLEEAKRNAPVLLDDDHQGDRQSA